MTLYVGIYDEQGYRVLADSEQLRLHHHYTDNRNWHTDNGLRQLALDLLIDALEEPIATDALAPRSGYQATDYTDLAAAWLPHLHYSAQLIAVARSNAYGCWELTNQQILTWLWDWMHERHLRTAKPRYSYSGVPGRKPVVFEAEQIMRLLLAWDGWHLYPVFALECTTCKLHIRPSIGACDVCFTAIESDTLSVKTRGVGRSTMALASTLASIRLFECAPFGHK